MLDHHRARTTVPAYLTNATQTRTAVSPAAIGLVTAQLAALASGLRAADRADPRHEALLCLVESAQRAAGALEASGDLDSGGLLEEALAAARAAVTAASFALVEQRPLVERRPPAERPHGTA